MAIKCPTCHSDNSDTVRFCAECGTQLPPPQDYSPVMTETLQTPVRELTTGSTFAGRYQVIEELGKGGMGRIYKVFDTKIKEKVALKLIKPEIATDQETIERFSNELKLARRIRHKNVCGMFDLGEAEGAHFITMEYVHGEDLKSMIHMSGSLSLAMLLSVGKQVCEGLAEAHSLGVVHRDLKPQNIMIDKNGNAKIMDFGIARSIKDKGITGAGVMIGTPEYMSPEQAEAKEVDHRSDIYSLGIILYEMATSRVPFTGETALSIAMKHKGEIPKNPKQFNPHIPDDLSGVILKCLEKNKAKRYQSASDVRSELEKIEKGIPTTERVVPERKPVTSREITVKFRLKKLFVPAAVVLLAITSALFFFLKSHGPRYDPKRVIVSSFENQTGDKSLDPIGRIASDWITQGLSKTGLVEVVTVPPGGTAPGTPKEEERIRALAKESSAGTLVSGTYFLQEKMLNFHARVSDMSKGKLIRALDPVSSAVEAPLEAINVLRQEVMGLLAVISDSKPVWDIDLSGQPPKYEAYKEYVEAQELWAQSYDMKGALEHLSRASELDPSFILPVLAASIAHYNLDEYAEAEVLAKRVDQSRVTLSPQEGLNLDWVKANLRGDQAEELRITRQLASKEGDAWKWQWALEAVRSNYPREAIAVLSKTNPAKNWHFYWGVMTSAFHMLREYKQALKQARRGRKQYPEDIDILGYEAYALAALGRTNELSKIIDESFGLKSKAWNNPGWVMISAGAILKVGGFKKEALQLLDRALQWIKARPKAEAETKDYRVELAEALYNAEKWEEARILYERLSKEDPEDLMSLGRCGALAARRGDREAALGISKQLEEIKKPYLWGRHTYWRAIIAAWLGEKETAVRLLQEAISQGMQETDSVDLDTDMDLEPLRDYPPFQELIKPKG